MREQDGLGDPRESYPEENPNAYAMHEPPARMELLADLLKETHRIEKHAAIMEDALDRSHRLLRDKQERLDNLAERVVKAERALVDCEEKDGALPAAVYLETLDSDYIGHLKSENQETRSV